MLHKYTLDPKPSQVTVRFGDGAHSFPLRHGATLTELADCIGIFGARHDGAPISIDIEFTAPRSIFSAQPGRAIQH